MTNTDNEQFVLFYGYERLNVNVIYTSTKAIFVISMKGINDFSIYRAKNSSGKKMWMSADSISSPNLLAPAIGSLIDRYLKLKAK